jgi:hypothetical protein
MTVLSVRSPPARLSGTAEVVGAGPGDLLCDPRAHHVLTVVEDDLLIHKYHDIVIWLCLYFATIR